MFLGPPLPYRCLGGEATKARGAGSTYLQSGAAPHGGSVQLGRLERDALLPPPRAKGSSHAGQRRGHAAKKLHGRMSRCLQALWRPVCAQAASSPAGTLMIGRAPLYPTASFTSLKSARASSVIECSKASMICS